MMEIRGNAMEYNMTAKSVLHQLGIGMSYSGYNYILYAIKLIEQDEELLTSITKILYIDIAKEFTTSQSCVERNIRKVIEVIWKKDDFNDVIIRKIFGQRYLTRKPSNKEFLELLYEYINSNNILESLFRTEQIICPISNEVCIAYKKIMEKLINLE